MNFAEYTKKLTSLKSPQKVFIAFLDILGFSKFIEVNSHEDVIKIYQSCLRMPLDFSLAEAAEQALQDSLWLKDVLDVKNPDASAPKLDNVQLNCISISDSIILSTTDCKMRDFIILIATVRNFLAKSLWFGFPLRGAISYGTLTMDNSSLDSNIIHHQMLGLPIVDAVNIEKIQNWSGCVIHKSVRDKIGPGLIRLDPLMLTLYDVPFKKSGKDDLISTELVVNWPYGLSDDVKFNMNSNLIRSKFSMHGKKINDSIEQKIANTIKFFEQMSEHPVYRDEMTNDEWWWYVERELKAF